MWTPATIEISLSNYGANSFQNVGTCPIPASDDDDGWNAFRSAIKAYREKAAANYTKPPRLGLIVEGTDVNRCRGKQPSPGTAHTLATESVPREFAELLFGVRPGTAWDKRTFGERVELYNAFNLVLPTSAKRALKVKGHVEALAAPATIELEIQSAAEASAGEEATEAAIKKVVNKLKKERADDIKAAAEESAKVANAYDDLDMPQPTSGTVMALESDARGSLIATPLAEALKGKGIDPGLGVQKVCVSDAEDLSVLRSMAPAKEDPTPATK